MPKVRDRCGAGVKFNSAVVQPYVRKPPRVSAALPWLYLKGISTGNMSVALSVLLGEEAKGLPANVISRLKAQWSEHWQQWDRRDLSSARYQLVAGFSHKEICLKPACSVGLSQVSPIALESVCFGGRYGKEQAVAMDSNPCDSIPVHAICLAAFGRWATWPAPEVKVAHDFQPHFAVAVSGLPMARAADFHRCGRASGNSLHTRLSDVPLLAVAWLL